MVARAVPVIADDIRRFILTSVPSVPYLEALLLLRGDAAHDWDAMRMARALYVSEATAASLLTALQAGAFVTTSAADSAFRYRPATPELDRMIEQLAAVYASHLVDVTNLIHARSSRKAQRFADAFVWKKDG